MWVVLETGSHANWVYRLLKRLGHEPLMGDTHRLALITQLLSKDDRTGAERLAELGCACPRCRTPSSRVRGSQPLRAQASIPTAPSLIAARPL